MDISEQRYFEHKYKIYKNKCNKMMGGGIDVTNPTYLIVGHGHTINPLKLFVVPVNIVIVPYSSCDKSAYFDQIEISDTSRREYIRNAEKKNDIIYNKQSLFPDMNIQINMEYTHKSKSPPNIGRKYFSYTGIIKNDYTQFSHPIGTNTLREKYHGWCNEYNGTIINKPVTQKALEHHDNSVMFVEYNKSYNLSQMIINIAQKNPNKTTYVLVSSCRNIKDADEIATSLCGIDIIKTHLTTSDPLESIGNSITKHLDTVIADGKFNSVIGLSFSYISNNKLRTKDDVYEMIKHTNEYYLILKYIAKHAGHDNFVRFLTFLKNFFMEGQLTNRIKIVNAEALCFLYKIIKNVELFNENNSKFNNVMNEIVTIKKINFDEFVKNLNEWFINFELKNSSTFQLSNKSEEEIKNKWENMFEITYISATRV